MLSQVYLNSCIMDWWGQAAFGQRRLCSVTVALVVGMAALLRLAGIGAARLWRERRRLGVRIAHGVAIVAMAWFLVWNWAWVNMYRHGRAAGFGTGRAALAGPGRVPAGDRAADLPRGRQPVHVPGRRVVRVAP